MGMDLYARYWVYREDDDGADFALDTSNNLEYLREKYENVAIWDDRDGEWL